MFQLAKLKDVVRIKSGLLKQPIFETIRDELNKKIANKVIMNLGLCICVKDILTIGDSFMIPGNGSAHSTVLFHCLVFKPKIGTVIRGKIRSCNKKGVLITLGFFDDVLIPPEFLQHPSRFDETEQVWVWEYPLPDGGSHDLYMDVGEPIKFRVEVHRFKETVPIGPPVVEGQQPNTAAGAPSAATVAAMQQLDPEIPFTIIGSVNDYGLGLVSWWTQKKNAEEDDAENEEPYENDENGEGACEE